MKVKSVLDIISHLMGEKSLSKKEMNEYDVNNDGVVDIEDLISIWEVFNAANELFRTLNCSTF